MDAAEYRCPPDVDVLHPWPGAAVVECKGEHDLTHRDQLDVLLAELIAENVLVVIDVSEAQFIDSSFLHSVAAASTASAADGGRVRLQVGTGPIVKTALEVSGILEHIEHARTRDEALA